jgi:hypothetical protein
VKAIRFLNVDLEIVATTEFRLQVLTKAMGDAVSALHIGPAGKSKGYELCVESNGRESTPDATIHALCRVIEKLPPKARKVWDEAEKCFDAGFEVSALGRFALRQNTLERMAKLGAKLVVTCYLARRET